jgi:Asp-tRNA(Asn)/Glu-tRNA(Gln) amidotransferase A subunit family amidase
LDTSYDDYMDILHLMETCRARMNQSFQGCDILLTPAADGEAPVGIQDTGQPRFQALWTMLHVPTITLPTHKGPNGLPVGIQLVSPLHTDRMLMAVSRWTLQAMGV